MNQPQQTTHKTQNKCFLKNITSRFSKTLTSTLSKTLMARFSRTFVARFFFVFGVLFVLASYACETVTCPFGIYDLQILEGRPAPPSNLDREDVIKSLEKVIRYAQELDIHVDILHEYIHTLNREATRIRQE